MPVARPKRPPTAQQLSTGTLINTDPSTVSRLMSDLVDATTRIDGEGVSRSRQVANLAIGDNTITHGLGRQVQHVAVTPAVADATFAWALKSSDSRTAVITVVGIAQPRCGLELS